MIDYTYRSRALAFISPGLGELTTAPPVGAAAGVDIRRVPVLVYELPPVHPRTGDRRVELRLVDRHAQRLELGVPYVYLLQRGG